MSLFYYPENIVILYQVLLAGGNDSLCKVLFTGEIIPVFQLVFFTLFFLR